MTLALISDQSQITPEGVPWVVGGIVILALIVAGMTRQEHLVRKRRAKRAAEQARIDAGRQR